MDEKIYEVKQELKDEISRLEARIKELEEKLDYFLQYELGVYVDNRIAVHMPDEN